MVGFAQISVGDKFPDGNFVYQVTTAAVANGKAGTVKILGVREGKNPVVDKVLVLNSTCSATVAEDVYNFTVTTFDTDALRKFVDRNGVDKGTFTGQVDAESVQFPKYITEIPAGALNGYTNMATVTFETGSKLTKVNDGAFATTQITTFDFSNCTSLPGLGDGVFVESGKTNSYITTVKLPATTLFKSIGAAFKSLTSLEKIEGLKNSSVTAIVANAFDGDAKLESLELPSTIQTIADKAFANSGIKTLTVDVTSLVKLGDGTDPVYGTTNVLKSLTLKGDLGGVINVNSFKGATKMETLDLSKLNFASKGQIAASAFEGCNNAKFTTVILGNIMDNPTSGYTIEADAFKGCTSLKSVTFGDINSAKAINGKAFDGCTKLATVTVGDVLAAGAIGDGTNPVFGTALKTVTVGTVKAGAAAILMDAFKYGDVSGTTLNLATGEGEYVSSDDASTAVIAADAFNFDAVVNSALASGFVFPLVNIGEIRSQGGAFAAGALSGDNIAQINFKGNIAKNGLNKMIIDGTCTVSKLVFDGTIGIGGIATGAFKALAATTVDIIFNGELAEGAIAAKAFESLKTGSKVSYLKETLTDATINPFDKEAFSDGTATASTTRIIDFVVANDDLEAAYKDASFEGLGTDGDFEIYLVKFYVAPVTPVDVNKFFVYQEGTSNTAWARYWGSNWADLAGVTTKDKLINRYQTLDNGAKVKLTLYGSYTDDPGAANGDPAIYMVPLKSLNGIYEIKNNQDEAIIVKAELVSGTFADKDIELSFTTTITNDSWWGTLHNTNLFINSSIITNQQLIDKTKPVPVVTDIYNGGDDIAYDLYVMNDPSKLNKQDLHNGFRIDRNVISKEKKTYIGEGWWCMLLRKTSTAAPAPVFWLDEPGATAIFAVKNVNTNEGNAAIYTLQGVRVSQTQKGMIYIQNGKKFIAK